ncbi:TonB-dependent receptor [Sphingomonas pseudosanguinis]|uniref:TonB-dependent receptor n=1 Tax=Sphingomonas pseudosanguinis TaxID=413712 RepID=UPI003F83C181
MPASHRLPLLAIALVTPTALSAQVGEPQSATITVTGRGLADRPGERALDVVTIDRDRITQNASQRLENVLADVAGLQQFRRSDSRSAHPTSQGITLRGLGGNASSRALLVLDGVPQADPFGGWVVFPAYATGRLGRIRVTRGGGSGFWGPGALAGTIEMDSATPDQLSPLDLAVAYGSRQSVDAQGSASLVRDGGFLTVSGAYARGDGFIPIVAGQRGPVDRPAPYEQYSGAARGVVGIAPSTELQMTLAAFHDARERGTDFTDNRSDGADASIRLVGRGAWGWSALGYIQTRQFASRYASVNAARTAATLTLDQYNVPATGLGARVEVSPPLGDSVTLRLGGDIRDTSGRTQELYTYVNGLPTRRREAGGATRTMGLFADGSAAFGIATLTAAARVDDWRIRNGRLDEAALASGAVLTDTDFPDRSGQEFTGRIGLAVRPVAPLSLRAAAYRGWRLPTLNELYRPFRAGADATAANAGLNPERIEGVEGGFDLTPATGLRLSGTYFVNRLTDAIANVTLGRGPGTFPGVGFVAANGVYRMRRNLDAIRAEGFELDANWTLGPIQARGSWSRTNARVRASGAAAALAGLRPAQTPRDQLSATLGIEQRGAALSGTVRHIGRQFEDDQNSRTLAPATTFDAYAAVPILTGWLIEARAENLANARVEAAYSGAGLIERATPRTLWIGVRTRL